MARLGRAQPRRRLTLGVVTTTPPAPPTPAVTVALSRATPGAGGVLLDPGALYAATAGGLVPVQIALP